MNTDDWQIVRHLIADQTGQRIGDLEVMSVSGGDINSAWRLRDGKHVFFCKTNQSKCLAMFEAEQHGLEEIQRSGGIRVPHPIGCGIVGDQAFMVMEFVDLSGRVDESKLARGIATMHLCTREKFGFALDNTIGSTPQPNAYESDWVKFWQQNRLGFQLSLAKKNGCSGELFETGMQLNQHIDELFPDYLPVPSLLHGDLWSGNQGADATGKPVIYDPACYYGDHEADLAMMELFGRPGELFFSVYREVFPIDDGYSVRRNLYNLYHILNHALLFGGAYRVQAQRMIDNLRSQM